MKFNISKISKNDEYDTWESIKQRVLSKCTSKNEFFKQVALAMALYDSNHAPSNWSIEYDHEKTIIDWTEYVVENYESYSKIIKVILRDYDKDIVPDCYKLLIDYFC